MIDSVIDSSLSVKQSTRPALVGSLLCLQAVRSGNPSQLQQAQLNIAQRRAGIRTPVGATPAGFGTPGASLLRTPGLGVTPLAGTPSMTPRLGLNTCKYSDSSTAGHPKSQCAYLQSICTFSSTASACTIGCWMYLPAGVVQNKVI